LLAGWWMIVGVERFQDDDAGYERWLAIHPDLFVLNTARNPRRPT
jgi:hypothetical protein